MVITTHDMLRTKVAQLNLVPWAAIFVDECCVLTRCHTALCLPALPPSCRPRGHAHQRGPHSEAARCHKLKDKKALITVAANGLDCVVRFGPAAAAPGLMRFS